MSTSIPEADREYFVRENAVVLVAELERGIKRRTTTIRRLLQAKKCLRERGKEQAAQIERLRAALEAIADNCLPLGMQDGDYQWRVPGSLMAAARAALSGK